MSDGFTAGGTNAHSSLFCRFGTSAQNACKRPSFAGAYTIVLRCAFELSVRLRTTNCWYDSSRISAVGGPMTVGVAWRMSPIALLSGFGLTVAQPDSQYREKN